MDSWSKGEKAPLTQVMGAPFQVLSNNKIFVFCFVLFVEANETFGWCIIAVTFSD